MRMRNFLSISMDEAVDIYEVIRTLRLWLLFEPLDGLFGMYQSQADASGMVINVKVHPALQRYTAAHELGHYVLGHRMSIDPERNISQWLRLQEHELSAQLFAAEFLMPQAAVSARAAELGLDVANLDEVGIYQLSLRLRTSYSATVVRLKDLGWLASADQKRLQPVAPKKVKKHLLPEGAKGDVWLVEKPEKSDLCPLVGDDLLLRLVEMPSTGFRWKVELNAGVTLIDDQFQAGTESDPSNYDRIGGEGHRRCRVEITEPVRSSVTLSLSRRWDRDHPARRFELGIDSKERPSIGVDPVQRLSLTT